MKVKVTIQAEFDLDDAEDLAYTLQNVNEAMEKLRETGHAEGTATIGKETLKLD